MLYRPYFNVYNMVNSKKGIIVCIGLLSLILIQCKKKTATDELNPEESFDKPAMLANVGDHIILPAYENLKIAVDSLAWSSEAFLKNPDAGTLSGIQTSFMKAYIRYESASTFEFGPADAELMRASFNVFPCDTLKINSKIAKGDFNFSTADDIDVKGFPALDFLLFNGGNTAVLTRFTSAMNASNSKLYLNALVTELKHKTDAVNLGWSSSGGNYIAQFKTNLGNSVGSSLGLLVNQLNFDYEILKNARISIPLGKKTLGVPYPSKVEAFYSTQSLTLALEQLKSLENIYLGRDAKGNDGLGFDDYLTALNTQHPMGLLNDVIKTKFIAAKAKLAAVQGPLAQAILTNPASVDAAYQELYQLTVLIKVDMPSALGVMITYEDNDGD